MGSQSLFSPMSIHAYLEVCQAEENDKTTGRWAITNLRKWRQEQRDRTIPWSHS